MKTAISAIVTLLVVLAVRPSSAALAQDAARPTPLPLWPAGAPGAKGSQPEDIPTISLYRPPADKASGAAIIVCPGGGYRTLADHEGHTVAVWLNHIGVTAAVLKYRLGPRYGHPAPMQDVLRAVRTLRARAAEWKIDPTRIGVMGFSAGGHLASTAATHFDDGNPAAADPIDRVSSRPDVAVLAYPVITMAEGGGHAGSRKNLLGDHPSSELIESLSNEKQVTSRTPPTFLFHTADDSGVAVENSLLFAAALRQAGVPYELHVYEKGKHGVGLAQSDPALSTWPQLLENWLRARGFLNRQQRASELKDQRKLPAEIESLINDARAAPAEFAADALIRIAESNQVADQESKRELLTEAFRLAPGAQHRLRRRYLGKYHVDTRTGYLSYAFDLKLDALSLQCRAVKAMLAADRQKARELFGEIPKLTLPAGACEDTLIYDVSDFYDALKEVAQAAFSPEQMRRDEHVRWAESYVGSIASPLQVEPAAKLILALTTSPSQLEILVRSFSAALEKISGDDRAFSFAMQSASRAVSQLVAACRQQDISRDELLEAYRAYLVKHLSAGRCADNVARKGDLLAAPGYVESFNQELRLANQPGGKSIPPIAADEIQPAKIEAAARFHSYWETPEAKKFLQQAKVLRFGPWEKQLAAGKKGESIPPLTAAERESPAWQLELRRMLDDLAVWDATHEKSEADYFHQKCVLFEALVELIPAGPTRNNVLRGYVAFLRQNRFQRESWIEWFFHADSLARRIRSEGEEARAQVLEALSDSDDLVLQLYVRLERLFPQPAPGTR